MPGASFGAVQDLRKATHGVTVTKRTVTQIQETSKLSVVASLNGPPNDKIIYSEYDYVSIFQVGHSVFSHLIFFFPEERLSEIFFALLLTSTVFYSILKIQPEINQANQAKFQKMGDSATQTEMEPTLSKETLREVLPTDPGKGKRLSGKNWKVEKKAFRIKSLGTSSSWKQKQAQRLKDQETKARLKELQAEKEAEKKARIDRIKEKREKKAEQERYERLATVMHAKRVERLKRREKRNKLLKER